MPIAAGSQIGRYEILGPLGAGGMGEVYRARDPRLSREVAIKVLPASFASDADRLRRFEQEARAAGTLDHPNLLAIHDIGTHDRAPYLVSELLAGETLRSRMAGSALAPRRAVEYALQVAQGLAAAHDKGIVHRDLKPENLFVTRDGRVKILDFGLAKLTQPKPGGTQTDAPTNTAGTDAGVVMGTAGYMSPEQARGKPSDHRSDVFAFGAILYEMLSGRRAFHGETAADTMTAILKEDPPELSSIKSDVPPGLERIVRHCLEKNAEGRFQSARDLAFDLEALSTASGGEGARTEPVARPGRLPASSVLVGLGLAAVVAAFLLGQRSALRLGPGAAGASSEFKRLTFGRGNVLNARVAPDGRTVVYGASWSGRPAEVFLTLLDSPESRPLGLQGDLLSISRSGELAVLLKKSNALAGLGAGTLARVPVAGGSPREIAEGVVSADWAPDGKALAIVRDVGTGNRIEYPIGKILYETAGYVPIVRVSPGGDRVAFVEQEYPSFNNVNFALSNVVAVVDRSGKKRTLARVSGGGSVYLAWHPSGNEIWVSCPEGGRDGFLFAFDLSGGRRRILEVPGSLTLHEVMQDGRALIEQDLWRNEMAIATRGGASEKTMTWLDSSMIADISRDGNNLLFTEASVEGGGEAGAAYLRQADGSPAVRLGDGIAAALSPDGRWALSIPRDAPTRLILLPTGPGEARPLGTHEITHVGAAWFPDGRRILAAGYETGHGIRAYVEDIEGSQHRPVTPEGLVGLPIVSPDGRAIAAPMAEGRFMIYPLDGGEPRPITGVAPGDWLLRWSSDGRSLLTYRPGSVPAQVFRVDLERGKSELWQELMPSDASGFMGFQGVVASPDGRSFAYTFYRVLYSNLFLAEGLR